MMAIERAPSAELLPLRGLQRRGSLFTRGQKGMGNEGFPEGKCGSDFWEFGDESFDPGFDFIPDDPGLRKLLGTGTGQLGRVAKTPAVALKDSGEDGTFFGAGLVTDGYEVVEKPSLFEQFEDTPGFPLGYVDPYLPHDFDCQGIQSPRLQPRTLCLEEVPSQFVQECLGHLAPSAVMHADEKYFYFLRRHPGLPFR
jgi:hypothetical protein